MAAIGSLIVLNQEILNLKKVMLNEDIENNISQSNYKARTMLGFIFNPCIQGSTMYTIV